MTDIDDGARSAVDAAAPKALVARDDLLIRRYDDRAVVWAPTAPEPVSLAPLTLALLDLLDGTVTVADLIDDLRSVLESDVDHATAVLDHQRSILDRAGLLATSPPPASVRAAEVFPAPHDP